MNYRMIGRINAFILLIEALFMIPAMFLALADRDYTVARAFLIAIGIIIAFSGLLIFICRHAKRGFYAREGFVCVGFGWILMSLFGSVPYWLSGEIPNVLNAVFETVSGFTTTGASIVRSVEDLARATNYWRCFTHWLGGMGVLVFLLILNPLSDKNTGEGMHLLRAESPGIKASKLVPRMRNSAEILYRIYIALTVLEAVSPLWKIQKHHAN